MREGSLEAPTRHPIAWTEPDFWDEAKLDEEMRRVLDICHGCRRCFNLCDSFPRLFDLVDNSPTSELDGVPSEAFKSVVDACTLCDMCFMTKCPYVPPHEFNLDFPHLMLRYRAVEARKNGTPFGVRQLTKTDRNGRLASLVAPIANWASATENQVTRPILEGVTGVDRRAELPKFHGRTFTMRAREELAPAVDGKAKARKAALYATCFVNYNNPQIGMAARAILARQGVTTQVTYPTCCGMPQLEQGEIAKVAERARKVSLELSPLIDEGWDIVALIPSCALMFKFEWPLIVPDDPYVKKLAAATYDISEYIVDIAKKEGLADGLQALPGGVSLHLACHARAQNMGQKAAEMLRLIPNAEVSVIERCSGHGGSWGVMQEWFEVALKVGKPVARQAMREGKQFVASECPLAGEHIVQGMKLLGDDKPKVEHSIHPVELFARAYGLQT
jgi:glycerol-3-phosphate dehydrogenase subunit C